MQHRFSFSKKEHLCGEIRINNLFTQGYAFIAYPIRVVYLIEEKNDKIPVRVLVSVPKKKFKKAVMRNRLKRMMREAYRLNKIPLVYLLIQKNLNIDIAFNYVSDEAANFELIEKKMIFALNKISEKIESNS